MEYSTNKTESLPTPHSNVPSRPATLARPRSYLAGFRLALLTVLLSASSLLAGVMMQGFYWNCPGPWYPTMQSEASALKNMAGGYGINRIWFPVPQKSASGGYSMGYDPYDYYDLGAYSQNGGPGTHFGTQTQLKNAVAAYKALGISPDVMLPDTQGRPTSIVNGGRPVDAIFG